MLLESKYISVHCMIFYNNWKELNMKGYLQKRFFDRLQWCGKQTKLNWSYQGDQFLINSHIKIALINFMLQVYLLDFRRISYMLHACFIYKAPISFVEF